jgi:DNA-binding NarL/FixJ family response regulator
MLPQRYFYRRSGLHIEGFRVFCFEKRCGIVPSMKVQSMAELKILVVDDEKVIRTALSALLKTRGDWKVIGEASDGQEAITKAKELRPDVIIMDLSMPQMDGLKATREIHREMPEAEVLIFTQHDTLQLVREAKEAGARGYLLKSDAQSLVSAVESVGQHKPFFGRENVLA